MLEESVAHLLPLVAEQLRVHLFPARGVQQTPSRSKSLVGGTSCRGCDAGSLELAHHLDDQRRIAERVGDKARRATERTVFVKGCQDGSVVPIGLHAPKHAPCPHVRPDRELSARRSMLDVAVREPEDEDRRCRDTRSVLLCELELRLPRWDRGPG